MLKAGSGHWGTNLAPLRNCCSATSTTFLHSVRPREKNEHLPAHQQHHVGFFTVTSRRTYVSQARAQHCLYELVGVTKTATEADIKSAYYEKAKRYHPDVNKEDPHAQKRFVELTEAYKVLTDKRKRREYDETREMRGTYSSSSWRGYGDINGMSEDFDDEELYDNDDATVEYMVWESGAPFGKGGKGGRGKGMPSEQDFLMEFIRNIGGFTFDKGGSFSKQRGSNSSFNTARRQSMYERNEKKKEEQKKGTPNPGTIGSKQAFKHNNNNNNRNNNNNNNNSSNNNNSKQYKGNQNNNNAKKTNKRGAFKAYKIIVE